MASDHADHEHGGHDAAYDDVNIRSIALVGGVGAVLVFVAVVAVQVIYFRYQDAEFDRKVVAVPIAAANRTIAEQREQIGTVGRKGYLERGETTVPIEEAMRAVVAEYAQRRGAEGQRGQNEAAAKDADEKGAAAVTGETAAEEQ